MRADESLGQLRALVLAAARGDGNGDLGPAVRCFLCRREEEGKEGLLAEQSLYRVLLFLATRAAAAAAAVAPASRPAGEVLAGSGHHGARGARGASGSGCGSTGGGGGGGLLGTVVGACRAGAGPGVASASASDSCCCSCQDRCGAGVVATSDAAASGAAALHQRWPVKGGFERAFARACDELESEERRLLRRGDLAPRDLALASRGVFGHLH